MPNVGSLTVSVNANVETLDVEMSKGVASVEKFAAATRDAAESADAYSAAMAGVDDASAQANVQIEDTARILAEEAHEADVMAESAREAAAAQEEMGAAAETGGEHIGGLHRAVQAGAMGMIAMTGETDKLAGALAHVATGALFGGISGGPWGALLVGGMYAIRAVSEAFGDMGKAAEDAGKKAKAAADTERNALDGVIKKIQELDDREADRAGHLSPGTTKKGREDKASMSAQQAILQHAQEEGDRIRERIDKAKVNEADPFALTTPAEHHDVTHIKDLEAEAHRQDEIAAEAERTILALQELRHKAAMAEARDREEAEAKKAEDRPKDTAALEERAKADKQAREDSAEIAKNDREAAQAIDDAAKEQAARDKSYYESEAEGQRQKEAQDKKEAAAQARSDAISAALHEKRLREEQADADREERAKAQAERHQAAADARPPREAAPSRAAPAKAAGGAAGPRKRPYGTLVSRHMDEDDEAALRLKKAQERGGHPGFTKQEVEKYDLDHPASGDAGAAPIKDAGTKIAKAGDDAKAGGEAVKKAAGDITKASADIKTAADADAALADAVSSFAKETVDVVTALATKLADTTKIVTDLHDQLKNAALISG